MERKRAAERNEKTDSITKERRRLATLKEQVAELTAWKEERLQEEEETREDRERLADLLERLAEEVESWRFSLEFGAGVNARTLLPEDLLRAAELIDPDN